MSFLSESHSFLTSNSQDCVASTELSYKSVGAQPGEYGGNASPLGLLYFSGDKRIIFEKENYDKNCVFFFFKWVSCQKHYTILLFKPTPALHE